MGALLLFGSNGQLGHAIRTADWFGSATALGRSECDLTDPVAIRAAIERHDPSVIVNAAAYTAVDRAEDEPELAHAVNASAPAVMAEAAAASGAAFIHYSTDYVYDGSKPDAYVETDPTGPLGVYGASKLAGEQAIAAADARHAILRTSWVYGPHGANFPKTMLRLAKERDELSIVADQWGAPTSVGLLADVTRRLIDGFSAEGPGPLGIYHCAPAGRTTWHGFAQFFLTCCGEAGATLAVDPASIRAIKTEDYPTKAVRPKNSVLSCHRLESEVSMTMPDWHDHVRALAQQLVGVQ
ncbi:MAG: dTDP-4-dehydrorhamnose reductase [Pseudomonadota bacterium]